MYPLAISVAAATFFTLSISAVIILFVRYIIRTKAKHIKPPFEDFGDWGRN